MKHELLIEALKVFFLCIPLFAELYADRDGDEHPNIDWLWRGVVMLAVSFILAFLADENQVLVFFRSFALSFGIFTLFFPYLVNIVHNKKRWWDSLSPTAWPDKVYIWRASPWWARLFFLLVIFGACVMFYFCPGKIVSFYNPCN